MSISHTIKIALRSSVAKNAASLYVIQFANYILPLITIPYLVRVLGPKGYGIVAFSQSLIESLMVIVNYGFLLSATRKISVERDDSISVNRTTFNVLGAKAFLCVIGFIILLLLIAFIPRIREVKILLLTLYGIVIGNVLLPVWLFQGMEKMVIISAINLVTRLLVLIGTFTMIHHPDDDLLYAGLLGIGSISAGIAGAAVAVYMFKLHPIIPSWRDMREYLVEGWTLFLSTASISLYTAGNALILGLLTNHTVVGYYSAAEKIVKGLSSFLGPISQAAYPKFSKMALESKTLALQWGRRMLLFVIGSGLIVSIVLFWGAPLLVRMALGSGYETSTMVMRILAALPLLISVSTVLATQIMLPFGKDKAFTSIVFGAGCINTVLAILLVPVWQGSGMAVAVLISELFVTIALLIYLTLHQINPLRQLDTKTGMTA